METISFPLKISGWHGKNESQNTSWELQHISCRIWHFWDLISIPFHLLNPLKNLTSSGESLPWDFYYILSSTPWSRERLWYITGDTAPLKTPAPRECELQHLKNLIPWEKKLISKSKCFWWWLANLPGGEKQNFSPPSLPYLSPPCLSPVPQNSPSVSFPATFIRSLVPPEILFSTVMCLMSGICATL